MGQPRPLFVFLFFSNTNFTEKTVDVSGIRTRIVGLEGKHADHLTTTKTQAIKLFCFAFAILRTKQPVGLTCSWKAWSFKLNNKIFPLPYKWPNLVFDVAKNALKCAIDILLSNYVESVLQKARFALTNSEFT